MTRGPSTTRSRAQWSLREAFGVLKDTPEMLLEELEASKSAPSQVERLVLSRQALASPMRRRQVAKIE